MIEYDYGSKKRRYEEKKENIYFLLLDAYFSSEVYKKYSLMD